ncbi:MAG: sigma-70 family RNA polymerase sigma factor [Phycisphaerales bacterium]|nr:sigma-70 family RNA polymerase sigma factor [Phycisphaerae bacterium]NNF42369.1 sigma-70 family RNA polymerase sigma factor [Phycisphaerales bacterium]NNM25200.1 sigma-70 family RNA polymerase sigma factor [Phycisphaerales bacterium]
MSGQSTRPSLLLRVRDHADHAAWREFDERYGELVVRFCRSRGLQHSDAEDLRQVVLINLASALRSFEYSPARGRFRSYLGRATRNAVARHLGRPVPRPARLETIVADVAAEEDRDADWEREWVRHHLRLAMRTVRRTFESRSVAVFDRLLSGVTTEQVAREFDMSTDAVHKVKQRIRNRLRELVADQLEQEDGLGD